MIDLEHTLGELSQMCDNAGFNYNIEGKELAAIMRVLQCMVHTHREYLEELAVEYYKGGLKVV